MKKVSRPNLPNSLTIFRVLALPFCAYALFKNNGQDSDWRIIAFALFFIVGLSDILDGKIARDRNQITELGKLLDPIADKAMLATATYLHTPRDLFMAVAVILTVSTGIDYFRKALTK
ncbi:MAG: CDP-alcohol phosphatidyltransferase family protein [Actinobacteria bacterium]|nr:CDP-alcohol phosphatidyltransferase family protein [Actinomycetota bacterium]NCU96711.1 CDP-alcohol phosphatidyltransferase family protein [Actinomycetota bacterium]